MKMISIVSVYAWILFIFVPWIPFVSSFHHVKFLKLLKVQRFKKNTILFRPFNPSHSSFPQLFVAPFPEEQTHTVQKYQNQSRQFLSFPVASDAEEISFIEKALAENNVELAIRRLNELRKRGYTISTPDAKVHFSRLLNVYRDNLSAKEGYVATVLGLAPRIGYDMSKRNDFSLLIPYFRVYFNFPAEQIEHLALVFTSAKKMKLTVQLLPSDIEQQIHQVLTQYMRVSERISQRTYRETLTALAGMNFLWRDFSGELQKLLLQKINEMPHLEMITITTVLLQFTYLELHVKNSKSLKVLFKNLFSRAVNRLAAPDFLKAEMADPRLEIPYLLTALARSRLPKSEFRNSDFELLFSLAAECWGWISLEGRSMLIYSLGNLYFEWSTIPPRLTTRILESFSDFRFLNNVKIWSSFSLGIERLYNLANEDSKQIIRSALLELIAKYYSNFEYGQMRPEFALCFEFLLGTLSGMKLEWNSLPNQVQSAIFGGIAASRPFYNTKFLSNVVLSLGNMAVGWNQVPFSIQTALEKTLKFEVKSTYSEAENEMLLKVLKGLNRLGYPIHEKPIVQRDVVNRLASSGTASREDYEIRLRLLSVLQEWGFTKEQLAEPVFEGNSVLSRFYAAFEYSACTFTPSEVNVVVSCFASFKILWTDLPTTTQNQIKNIIFQKSAPGSAVSIVGMMKTLNSLGFNDRDALLFLLTRFSFSGKLENSDDHVDELIITLSEWNFKWEDLPLDIRNYFMNALSEGYYSIAPRASGALILSLFKMGLTFTDIPEAVQVRLKRAVFSDLYEITPKGLLVLLRSSESFQFNWKGESFMETLLIETILKAVTHLAREGDEESLEEYEKLLRDMGMEWQYIHCLKLKDTILIAKEIERLKQNESDGPEKEIISKALKTFLQQQII